VRADIQINRQAHTYILTAILRTPTGNTFHMIGVNMRKIHDIRDILKRNLAFDYRPDFGKC